MKRKSIKNLTKKFVVAFSIVLLAAVCVTSLAFTTQKLYENLWANLGLARGEAEFSIGNSFLYGYLQHYSARNIRSIAQADRVGVVKELGSFAKEYVNSEDFKRQYQTLREQKKPLPPASPKTADEIRREKVDEIGKAIESTEASMEKMQDDMKPLMQTTIDMLRQQLNDYADPNSEMINMLANYEKMAFEYGMQDYGKNMLQWEEEWPEDQLQLVKKRLQEFLDKTGDIDFNATLTTGYGGKKIFVNPDYESKPADWKKAFRAGKEATSTAREFVQAWLKELE